MRSTRGPREMLDIEVKVRMFQDTRLLDPTKKSVADGHVG